jgi:FtsH-binding integral membrane protein
MRTLIVIVIGIALAGVFDAIGAAVNDRRVTRGIDGGWLFIWAWLMAAIADFGVGVVTGHPVLAEFAIHLAIFVVPAAVAWYLSHRRATPRVGVE